MQTYTRLYTGPFSALTHAAYVIENFQKQKVYRYDSYEGLQWYLRKPTFT